MNWAEHNLLYDQGLLRVLPWQNEEWLVHGFSTRELGNMSFRHGEASDVLANRQKLMSLVDIPADRLTAMQQEHHANVHVVEPNEVGRGAHDFDSAFADTDGMISGEPAMAMIALVADCVPLLLMDPVTKLVGTVHAGRRGTILNIAGEAIKRFAELCANANSIQAAIGPSIGPCCYEVSHEIIEEAQELLCADKAGSALYKQMLASNHFDLWGVNELLLRRAGVDTIIRTNVCTLEHAEVFYSYRENNKTGRFAGLIGIR